MKRLASITDNSQPSTPARTCKRAFGAFEPLTCNVWFEPKSFFANRAEKREWVGSAGIRMKFAVPRVCDDFEVFFAVVVLVTIAVMHNLMWCEKTTQSVFSHYTMQGV